MEVADRCPQRAVAGQFCAAASRDRSARDAARNALVRSFDVASPPSMPPADSPDARPAGLTAAPRDGSVPPASDSASDPTASASVERDGGATVVRLAGRLDAHTVGPVWATVFGGLGREARGSLRVDGSEITYCDGAGLGVLVQLDHLASVAGGRAEFVGISDDLRALLERARLPDSSAGGPPSSKPSLVPQVGMATARVFRDLVTMVAFLGEIVAALIWAATHPTRIRWRDAALLAEKAGADAVPVCCLLGWLMGLIISFQAASPLGELGVESLIPTMLGFAMIRELGPLVTAIILAGRSGSAFAAAIGTMKVTQELDALETFGLRPVRFLVVPRLIAAMAMTPLLSVFTTLMGLVGGYVIMAGLGYGLDFYINQIRAAIDYVDFLQGVFKAFVFAFLVTAIGCVKGLQTSSGPQAVGDSTTAAVVAGIVLVIVADGILGVVFYFIGV